MARPNEAPGVPSRAAQIAGSLTVAVVIVVVTILLVTARIGTNPELLEEREKDRQDLIEEQRETQEELRGG
jgi:hypothetical protein